jgi:hypothetical protein
MCQPRVIMVMMKLVERWLAGETEVLGENLPQYRFVHHKPHMICPDLNPGRRGGKPATNRLSYGTAWCLIKYRDMSTVFHAPIRKQEGLKEERRREEQRQEMWGGKEEVDEENCEEDYRKRKEIVTSNDIKFFSEC